MKCAPGIGVPGAAPMADAMEAVTSHENREENATNDTER
jgi:hypothetical protein